VLWLSACCQHIRRQPKWHLLLSLRLELVEQTLSLAQICAYEWEHYGCGGDKLTTQRLLLTASQVNDADPVSYTVLGK
jgi:hypothetical protein